MPLTQCPACGKEISTEATACPKCGHPLEKLAARKNQQKGRLGCFTIILIVAGFVTWAVITDNKSGENSTTFDVNEPQTITSIIHGATAHPTATFDNGKLSLTYSIEPIITTSLAKNAFFIQAKEFFQTAFSSPLVHSACVEGTATFQDIRGNQSQGKALSLCMSHATENSVRWDNIYTGNMPSIADTSFIHPSFNK
ncbi:MAG: zinc ribbon domain-containing protein [Rhodopila sp.]|jgi:predicted nucleic acid-binding Zn ribbon protein